MELTFSLPDIDIAAMKFMERTEGKKVFCFYGDMGAGKTTFIQAFCKKMRVTGKMSSPTFSIINEYAGINNEPLYHMDLYRLKDEREAIAAGVEDCIYSGNICLVEWPEIIEQILPENAVKISLSLCSANKRLLKII